MINLPKKAIEASKSDLSYLYSQYNGFGFVVPHMAGSQMLLSLINNINNYLVDHPYNEIALYYINKEKPIINPNCSMFNIFEIRDSKDPMIAIDPISWAQMNYFYSKKKLYYIYDILLLKYIPPIEIEKMKKSDTIFFTRSKEHSNFIKTNFGLNTINKYVYDFDMNIIKEIVNEFSCDEKR
jgi:hypothetical protein